MTVTAEEVNGRFGTKFGPDDRMDDALFELICNMDQRVRLLERSVIALRPGDPIWKLAIDPYCPTCQYCQRGGRACKHHLVKRGS